MSLLLLFGGVGAAVPLQPVGIIDATDSVSVVEGYVTGRSSTEGRAWFGGALVEARSGIGG